MALVAACCRWPGGDARDAAIRAAAAGVDWPLVDRLLDRHRVRTQAAAALAAAGVVVPHALAARWRRTIARTVRDNLLQAAQSLRLQALLDERDIPALIVKGAVLGEQAFGGQNVKQSKDIDIFVRPEDIAAARHAIEQAGYRMVLPLPDPNARQFADIVRFARDLTLVHPVLRVSVELHWRLTENPRVLPMLDPAGAAESVTLGGGWGGAGATVRTLPRDDLIAYLCVHGAAHGWVRLKWLADMAALLSHETPVGLVARYDAACARGVGTIAGQTLLLCADLLALPLPPGLAAALRGDARVRRLMAPAFDLLAGPGADAEIGDRAGGQRKLIRARIMLSRDLHDRWVYMRAHAIALQDVLALPLPRALHFLYIPLRLPMWAGRRLFSRP